MKTVTATIVYPVEVKVEVNEDASLDFIWQEILAAADQEIGRQETPPPVIYDCSEKLLLHRDIPPPEEEGLEDQSQIFQKAIEHLQNTKEALNPLLKHAAFFAGVRNKQGEYLNEKLIRVGLDITRLLSGVVEAMSKKP